jgi:hypothetical protein
MHAAHDVALLDRTTSESETKLATCRPFDFASQARRLLR